VSAVSLLVLWSPDGSDPELVDPTPAPTSIAPDPTANTAERASAMATAGPVVTESPEESPASSPTPSSPEPTVPPTSQRASPTPTAVLTSTPEPTDSRPPRQTVVPVTLSRRPTPTPTPAPGLLQFRVSPWAEVSVDGKVVGTTPFKPVRLEAGDHEVILNEVILSNPSFMPLHKKVTILPGQTLMLEVDLSFEAFPKR